jgi:hypothetical protein
MQRAAAAQGEDAVLAAVAASVDRVLLAEWAGGADLADRAL